MKANEEYKLVTEVEECEKQITKLEKSMMHPLLADLISALTISVILNTSAHITDRYTLMEYLRYVSLDTVGFMPVSGLIAWFVNELNKEKKVQLKELFEKVNELKIKLNRDDLYVYDYPTNNIEKSLKRP